MKHLIAVGLFGILMLSHQQWEQIDSGKFRLVYVVFERGIETKDGKRCEKWDLKVCQPVDRIRFTIPVPNTPTKAMSKAEAATVNKKLEQE